MASSWAAPFASPRRRPHADPTPADPAPLPPGAARPPHRANGSTSGGGPPTGPSTNASPSAPAVSVSTTSSADQFGQGTSSTPPGMPASLVETILAAFGPATAWITFFLVLFTYICGLFPISTRLYASSIHVHPRTGEIVPALDSFFDLDNAFIGEKTTVTVVSDLGSVDWPASLFTTGSAERFGSGAFTYKMVDKSVIMFDEKTPEVAAPCIIVSRNSTAAKAIRDSAAHRCVIFVMADEYCLGISTPAEAAEAANNNPGTTTLDEGVEMRQYDALDLPQGHARALYVPLGPRIDFWNEIQKFSMSERAFLMRSSVRPLTFNSVYSLSTSVSRVELARVLGESNGTKYRSSSVTAISSRWTRSISEDPEKIEQRHYARILLQSVFTLSPAGHNPECYRTFEAIEAGSIPIIALDDFYNNHPCQDSLWRLRMEKAPMVILQSWAELPVTLETLLSNPQGLDNRQEKLVAWYRQFMNTRMEEMENVLQRNLSMPDAGYRQQQ